MREGARRRPDCAATEVVIFAAAEDHEDEVATLIRWLPVPVRLVD